MTDELKPTPQEQALIDWDDANPCAHGSDFMDEFCGCCLGDSRRWLLDRLVAAAARANEYAHIANAAEYLLTNAEKHPDACCPKCSANIEKLEAADKAVKTIAIGLNACEDQLAAAERRATSWERAYNVLEGVKDDYKARLVRARAALQRISKGNRPSYSAADIAVEALAALAGGEGDA